MKKMKTCVVCGVQATSWSAHVLDRDDSHIIAGWCKEHSDKYLHNPDSSRNAFNVACVGFIGDRPVDDFEIN